MTVSVIFYWFAAAGVATALGFFITSLLWPENLNRALIWAFAPAIGLGLCSLIFFIFRRPMFTVEFGLLLVLGLLFLRSRRPTAPMSWKAPVSVIVLAVALGWGISGMFQRIERMPHGDWDAWAIWNSHSRYLYRDGPAWKDNIKNTFHADYPLLTASLVARGWRYAGEEVPDSGGTLGILFVVSGLAILFGTLTEIKDLTVGTVFGLVLISTPFYLEHGVSQSADVPLAIYFLGSVALMSLHLNRAPKSSGLLVLSGFSAGLAAWTKNEGLVVVASSLVVLAVSALPRPREMFRRLMPFAAGLLLPLAVIFFFKWTVAPANDIFGNRHYAEFVAKIFSWDRQALIMKSLSEEARTFGGWRFHPLIPMLAFIAVSGLDLLALRRPAWLTAVMTLILVFLGYLAVYLITPMELKWHLDSSLSRLLLHLWPTFLLVLALPVRLTPSEPRA